MRRLLPALAAALLAAAPLTSAAAQQPATFLGYTTTVPKSWVSTTPSSNMRLAQYTIPGAPGSIPVEVVVYFFGPGQGGDGPTNIERWRSQFSNPDGSPVTPVVTKAQSGNFLVWFAELRGTYARGVGAGSSAAEARPNHMLLAAIIETPKGTLFVQEYGPAAATEAQRDLFRAFVMGLK